MGISITQTMNGYQFENGEDLRNTAGNILSRQGVSKEDAKGIIDRNIFNSSESKIYSNAQLAILKASSQISLKGTLKETYKYLKNGIQKNPEKKVKFGMLWEIFNEECTSSDNLVEIEIDYSAENIFAAA